MPDRMRKVLHAFAALADLGEEIAETNDFEEMVRSALHVVLGALGIRRGAVAEFERESSALRVVATRGFGETFPPEVSSLLKIDSAHACAQSNGCARKSRRASMRRSRRSKAVTPSMPISISRPASRRRSCSTCSACRTTTR